MGRLKGETTMTEQTYRYDKTKWTEAQAKTHCEGHNGTFEPASEAITSETNRWLPVAKANQTKITEEGEKIILTEEALVKSVNTWKGGKVTINHKEPVDGLEILDAKYDKPFLRMLFDKAIEKLFTNTDSSGWSVETDNIEFDGNKIISCEGVGISILYPPHLPACTREMGCYETITDPTITDFHIANFSGRVLSAESEGYIRKARDALDAMLKKVLNVANANKEKDKGVKNQEENLAKKKMDEEERKELTSKFETANTELEKIKAEIETAKTEHETEVKALKDSITAFEQKETDEKKAILDAEWETLKKEHIPPGLTNKEEDEKALREQFEQSPHEFMLKLVGFEHKTGTDEEGNEFTGSDDDIAAILKERDEEAGIGFEVSK